MLPVCPLVLLARCGGVLSELNGVILSPGFPGNYPGNLDCTWQIILPTGYGKYNGFTKTRCSDTFAFYILVHLHYTS